MTRGRAPWLLALVALGTAGGGLTGCVPTARPPAAPPAILEEATPDPGRIEALLVLVGDAGAAVPGADPVLAAAAADVETWAPLLDPGEVTAVFLGDLVYPEGVRPSEHPGHARDTLALHAQLRVVTGPGARASGADALFVAGNHDWGDRTGAEGLARLELLADRVRRWRAAGHPVAMWPEPGAVAPARREVGEAHLVLGLDTQDWLQADPHRRAALREAWADALASAGSRAVTVLAHHPLQSAGEHGDAPPGDLAWGIVAAFSRAGAIVQDATAPRYRGFIDDVVAGGAATRAPRVWVAGHDHTLQLLRGRGPGWPSWSVVSGSASKVGILGQTPDLVAGGAWPGYARLFLLDDGSTVLQLVAGAPGALTCARASDVAACMSASVASFRTVLSRRLR